MRIGRDAMGDAKPKSQNNLDKNKKESLNSKSRHTTALSGEGANLNDEKYQLSTVFAEVHGSQKKIKMGAKMESQGSHGLVAVE